LPAPRALPSRRATLRRRLALCALAALCATVFAGSASAQEYPSDENATGRDGLQAASTPVHAGRSPTHASSPLANADALVRQAFERADRDLLDNWRLALLEDARAHLVLEEPREAEVLLKRALGTGPSGTTLTRIRVMQGLAALEGGQGARALEHFNAVEAASVPAPLHLELLKARAQRAAGQPDASIATYKRILAARPESNLLHIVRAELSDTLFAAGHCEEVDKGHAALLDLYPEYPQTHIALYQRAQCLIKLDRPREAFKLLHAVWFDFPYKEEGVKARILLDTAGAYGLEVPRDSNEALLDRATELRKRRYWSVAEDAFEELLAKVKTESGYTKLENDIRLQLALTAFERQDWETAIERLTQLEYDSRTPGRVAGLANDFVRLLLQRSWQRSGDAKTAEGILQERLKGRPSRVRDRELGEFYWDTGQYKLARKHLDRVLSKFDKNGWDYAFLLYKSGSYKQAEARFVDLARHASGLTRAQYVYWLGRAREMQGDNDGALAAFGEVAREYPLEYYSYQADNRVRDIEARRPIANTPQAERQTPRPVVAPRVVQASEPLAAPPELACNAEAGPWSPVPAGFFDEITDEHGLEQPVTGVALDEGAEPAAPARNDEPPRHHDARVMWDHAARVHWRGADLPPEAPEHPVDPHLPAYATPETLTGAARAAADRHGDLFPSLAAAAFLHDIGMHKEARLELRHVALEYRGLDRAFAKGARPAGDRAIPLSTLKWDHYIDHRGSSARGFWGVRTTERRFPVSKNRVQRAALAERQRAIYDRREALDHDLKRAMMEVGDYHMVRLMRLESGRWWRKPPEEARQEWSEAYPRAFPVLVQKYAAREGVNPYLLWALMTVESAYNPDSVSFADARGLLQVIPKTGNKVADSLGDNPFGPYDLLDPETSIRHGAWYFARLVEKYHGQEPFAIASYNGGPHNVARWYVHKHHIPTDEFVEEIPFTEARRYTKKVLRFLALFRRLYEGQRDLYVGQVMDPEFGDEPRY